MLQWTEDCGTIHVQCTFSRVDETYITGHCDDGSCAVDWAASPR